MTQDTVKQNQKVTVSDKYEYGNYVLNQTGIVVKIMDTGVNVFINAFPTLPYQDNIFFFPYSAIK